jgi:hypothetical protein
MITSELFAASRSHVFMATKPALNGVSPNRSGKDNTNSGRL